MQIFVKTPTGKTITLDVKASYTIADIQSRSLSKIADLYVSFQSRPLEDGRTLSDYNIQAAS